MSRPLTLAEVLGQARGNGLYRLPAGMAVPGALRLDGRRLTGKPAMLDALSQALALPDYFGSNWDALEECLADLSGLEGGVVLVVDHAEVPEAAAPDDWGILLDILSDAAHHWQAEGRPFAVFLAGGHAAYPLIHA